MTSHTHTSSVSFSSPLFRFCNWWYLWLLHPSVLGIFWKAHKIHTTIHKSKHLLFFNPIKASALSYFAIEPEGGALMASNDAEPWGHQVTTQAVADRWQSPTPVSRPRSELAKRTWLSSRRPAQGRRWWQSLPSRPEGLRGATHKKWWYWSSHM